MYLNDLKRWHKSIRVKEYDYAQPGMYFITICTENRTCCLGDVFVSDSNGIGVAVGLSDAGKKVEEIWLTIPEHHKYISLDEYIIMPNHLHGIIKVDEPDRRGVGALRAMPPGGVARYASTNVGIARNAPTTRTFIKQPSGSLSTVVASFKSAATNAVRKMIGKEGFKWQRNYYERIIRNEKELEKIRRYIRQNPIAWFEDIENPKICPYLTEFEIHNHYERKFR